MSSPTTHLSNENLRPSADQKGGIDGGAIPTSLSAAVI